MNIWDDSKRTNRATKKRLAKEHAEGRRQCRDCGEVKAWLFLKRSSCMVKIYADAEGRRWNGTRCPECNAKKFGSTEYQRGLRQRRALRAKKQWGNGE